MLTMPAIFIGHGSPMNAIEDNSFNQNWRTLTTKIPKPKTILVVSAHWYTRGTHIMGAMLPKMIYDMYGFPHELYEVVYNAPGAPEIAHRASQLISRETTFDNSWGYDHGAWSVLNQMFPQADIPVFQISVDGTASANAHFELGQQLKPLRDEGVLILGSGNVVHNLRLVNSNMAGGYEWAGEFDAYIKESIIGKQFNKAVNYHEAVVQQGMLYKLRSTTSHCYISWVLSMN